MSDSVEIESSVALGPFVEGLGLRFLKMSPDEVTAQWDAAPRFHQPHGILHGGVHCSLVETLASIGAGLWLGAGGRAVGVSNSTEFLRGVTTGSLTSRAEPVHRGRTQQLWRVETHDESGRLVALGHVRLQNLVAD